MPVMQNLPPSPPPLRLIILLSILLSAAMAALLLLPSGLPRRPAPVNPDASTAAMAKNGNDSTWQAPDTAGIPSTEEGRLIRYGRELIANTSIYLGPKGKIAAISNGMNCQNCHLDAGARPYANSFAAVAATYPKYRDRSGRVESIEFRINECMERSLNGRKMDSAGREVRAMVAWFNWIGKGVSKGHRPPGAGTVELPFLAREADTAKGRIIYVAKCQSCHGATGEGLLNAGATAYTYPPLWGDHSYNVSAGLYRISRLSGFIKYAMPFGSSHTNPLLADEEAWDLAAFINGQPHPKKFFSYDWPAKKTKPVDYPFGPYTDSFPERQHKYGPFAPIVKGRH
jgi:thiosulfate dehydrogenase